MLRFAPAILIGCALAVSCAPAPRIVPSPTPVIVAPTNTATSFPTQTATPTIAPSRTPSLTPTITLTPTPTLAPNTTLLQVLVQPFADEAQRRRAERARIDPEYAKRIDSELNRGRVNFLLFGYGETYEPPAVEKAIIGSQTIISYNTRTGKVDLISLTHDTRAPEIERVLRKNGKQVGAIKADQAYDVGGFELMRQVLEDATGLSIDFQVSFKDTVIQSLTDEVFGTIQVDVPADFDVWAFYLEGRKYDIAHFAKGREEMNGVRVIQFIKAIESTYDKSYERNVRKVLVFRGILDALNKNCGDYGFWLRLSGFLAKQVGTRQVAYDFDPFPLLINNLGSLLPNLGKLMGADKSCGIGVSKINQAIYIVDPTHGDGGVQWAAINANYNPITRQDIERKVYPDSGWGYEVPLEANPYGELITQYWTSIRSLVKESLSKVER